MSDYSDRPEARSFSELAADILRALPGGLARHAKAAAFHAAQHGAAALGLDLRTAARARLEARLAVQQAEELAGLSTRLELVSRAGVHAEEKLDAVTRFLDPRAAAREERKA